MSIVTRAKLIFQMKAEAALDEFESPVQVLDHNEAQHRELLRKVSQGLIEVVTARERLDRQARRIRSQIPLLEDQARRAIGSDRDDLARAALERKQLALSELTDLESHLETVAEEERSLMLAHRQLTRRLDEVRRHRTTLGARYQSASARVKVADALTGVSGELSELMMAVERADETTERLSARAGAIDALLASGTLSDPIGGVDRVERELREINSKRAVEEAFERLKREVQGQPVSDQE